MDDDRIDRGLLQQHDVAGEFARLILRAHGVAAVFDDDDFLVIALHIGQGFRRMRACTSGLVGSLAFIGSIFPALLAVYLAG